MIINKILKTKRNPEPFFNSCSDIDKENISIVIGEDEKHRDENISIDGEQFPKILSLICKIIPKKEFPPNVILSGIMPDEQFIKFPIYDGKFVNMANFVSGIELEFQNFNPIHVMKDEIPEEMKSYFDENKIIFSVDFQIQNFSESVHLQKVTNNFSSKLLPFAGYFAPGISPKNIQQHFFFISKDIRKSFMQTISPQDIINLKTGLAVQTAIKSSQIQSLEDIIAEKKITINIDDIHYTSLMIKKSTFTSNIVEIYFIQIKKVV